VIVPPYTFIATINAVLLFGAMPVFVDTDPDTFQIDHRKIEAAITPQTVAIIPVHLGGGTFHVDSVMASAVRRRLPVIEDACQSHLAEWKGRKVGTFGLTGCFSFQASKNLNCGEGGAMLTNSDSLIEKAYSYHNNGRGRAPLGANVKFEYVSSGANLRLTELQGALLLAQMTRLEKQMKSRETNAAYLTSLLREIPGVIPAKDLEGCTRNAYHLYMMRYDSAKFAGLSRDNFLKAVNAEGIPAGDGYSPLQREPSIRATLTSRGGQRVFSKERIKTWDERNVLPVNDKLCAESVWLTQNMLIGERNDMDEIAAAIRRISKNAAAIKAKLA
jgi:perosamine synthetase